MTLAFKPLAWIPLPTIADETLFYFFFFPCGLAVAAVFAENAVPVTPTACDIALLPTCVLVFFTNPIGFLNICVELPFPSSEMLKDSWIPLTRGLSRGALFF